MNHEHHNHEENIVYNKHEGHHAEDFIKKFWVCFILSIPIILYSDLPKLFFDWNAPIFYGSNYISLILGSIIYFYGGLVFIKGAINELRNKLPGMMTLIAIAITTAYLYSVWSVFTGSEMTLFWELSTLIIIMLIGHWVEMKAVENAKGALHELIKLLPNTSEILREGKIYTIPTNELKEGDMVLVRPGGKIPADGVIVEGDGEVRDTSTGLR